MLCFSVAGGVQHHSRTHLELCRGSRADGDADGSASSTPVAAGAVEDPEAVANDVHV